MAAVNPDFIKSHVTIAFLGTTPEFWRDVVEHGIHAITDDYCGEIAPNMRLLLLNLNCRLRRCLMGLDSYESRTV